MLLPVATKDPAAVEVEVQKVYTAVFPGADRLFVPRAFGWVLECFTGSYEDYLAIDARYHDLEHTLQGTLCMMYLLYYRHLTGAQPPLTERPFQLGLLAILLHDTGYLKRRSDADGTGAKYTATHVDRSAEFAASLLTQKGFAPADVLSVQNMIHCTGVNMAIDRIPFQSELERVLGCSLGTADLLGQMAAEDYVDKLPILYEEFAEAADFSKDPTLFVASFANSDDLLRRTPLFWEKFVLPKLAKEYLGLYRYLNVPYPDGPNAYIQAIQANIDRLKQQAAAKA